VEIFEGNVVNAQVMLAFMSYTCSGENFNEGHIRHFIILLNLSEKGKMKLYFGR
jgi:hypothetical protein